MLGDVGSLSIALAAVGCAYGALATWWGIRRDDRRWRESGRNALYAGTALLALALALLLAAFLTHSFRLSYVAQHSSRALPLYLRVSAVWAGQEGSLLLWAFLQTAVAALVVARPGGKGRELVPWATVVLAVVALFFTMLTLAVSNPFEQPAFTPADGTGLNPLLRHPGMIFHPPTLFVGYVALAVPFAFAMAGLVTGKMQEWPSAARGWTLTAWLFLGVGILLGARWAYDVLGWGGYWAWDPVENAALMPWLTATGLLHGSVMQDRRRGFRLWNWSLALASFVLVIFGTFATRSGMIQSVHAFGRSSLGTYFLAAIGLTLVVSLALLAYKRRALEAPEARHEFSAGDGTFLLTLLLLVTLTASVFVGSVMPTITEATSGNRFEATPEWFDRVTGPQFGALVLLMGVCPLLGGALAVIRRSPQRLLPGALGLAALPVVALLNGFSDVMSLVAFAIAGFAGGTTVAEYARAVRGRGLGEALRVLGANRRRYGGFLVHVGVVLMAVGVVGSRTYAWEQQSVLQPGVPTAAGNYLLVYEEARQDVADDHFTYSASVAVYRNGAYMATMAPRIQVYSREQSMSVPAVVPGVREDFYLILAGFAENGNATVKAVVNPLINFLWLGGLVFLAGGTFAVWPAAQRQAGLDPAVARRRMAGAAVATVSSLLVLAAAGASMWGGGHGVTVQAAGRPLVGQPPPSFVLSTLDGGQVFVGDGSRQIVVINFWATWCKQCEEELPALQSVWESYRDRGVTMVGVAYKDQEQPLRGFVERFGLTYPTGLDVGDSISKSYGITGIPETFVIDRDGRVAAIYIGPVTAAQLSRQLDRLLEG